MKVLVASSNLARRLKEFQIPGEVEIISPENGTDEEMVALAAEAEIIVCTRLSPEVIKSAPNLKFIQKTGAGVDAIPFDSIPDDVLIANTSGANSVPLAEGTIALMLTLAKQIVPKHNAFPGHFSGRGTELRDKTVGIIGLGNIGREIAKRLRAFDMNIIGIKRTPSDQVKKELNLEFLGGPEELDHLMQQSDFVILTVALTPATRGIIGKHQLELMKPTAYIVNVGRAALIDEEPLYTALKERKIAGAGLDVWWVPHWWDPTWYPETDKPSHFPIWELENVVCTPHSVGAAEHTKYSDKPLELIAENIGRIAAGKPPINPVDKLHQY